MQSLFDEFDDVVVFELPTFEDVEVFCDRFHTRLVWSHADERAWLFAAAFASDLATLLREAQEVVEELGLPDIGFSLDGRAYVLEAAVYAGVRA